MAAAAPAAPMRLFALFLAFAIFLLPTARAASDLERILEQELWSPRDAYDAAHVLMVPLHRAYLFSDQRRMEAYRGFVRRYLNDPSREILGTQTDLQFSYLLSRFLVLDSDRRCSQLDRKLGQVLLRKAQQFWTSPAWQWEMPNFPTAVARLEWKLRNDRTNPSYLRAIIDEELFALAISSDLAKSLPECGIDPGHIVERAVANAYQVFRQEGIFLPNGGWVFQPGAWTDHPDYAYAGNEALALDLPKKKVGGIGPDSSHSARHPLLIQSVRCAFPTGSDEHAYLGRITDGLRRQLMEEIIQRPTPGFKGVRLRNFMTGENGVYRYGYATVGPGGGYGPFGLSFTFNLGWWSFLGGDLSSVYLDQLASLPFDGDVLALYMQPIVTIETAPRDRHPSFNPKSYLRGALLRVVLAAARDVADRSPTCP